MSAPCPSCHLGGGFHEEETHAAIPVAYGKLLPPLEVKPLCRACGEPVDAPGLPGCRYPGHPPFLRKTENAPAAATL